MFTFCVYFLGADTFNQTSLNNSLVSLFEKFIAAIFTSLSAQGLNKTWVVAREFFTEIRKKKDPEPKPRVLFHLCAIFI